MARRGADWLSESVQDGLARRSIPGNQGIGPIQLSRGSKAVPVFGRFNALFEKGV
jgi:hypothetical protein